MNEKLVVDLDAVALWGSLTRGDPPWLPGITDPLWPYGDLERT